MSKRFRGQILITVEAEADFDDEREINQTVKEHLPFSGVFGGTYHFEVKRLVGWKKKPKRKSR